MLSPLLAYALVALSVTLALLGIVLVNLAVLPTVRAAPRSVARKVAVLVPARNEEANVEACLRSLLAQDCPDLEVWAYDDASTDRTGEITARLAAEVEAAPATPPLYIVHGSDDPPPGWLGKAHACHRLYAAMREHSTPDYVLFTDADVRFEPGAVAAAVELAGREGAGLLSAFPRQEMDTWAERLAVPALMHWTVYSFLPLPAAYSRHSGPAFAAANGQFMLFTREAYDASGGHSAVRDTILEDVSLARAVKRAGYRAILADTGPLVRTRMYRGAGEVWRGYSKNAYAFFGYSPLFLGLGAAVLLALYVAPPLLAVWAFFAGESVAALGFAGAYLAALAARVALAVRFAFPVSNALLHPVAVLYMIAIQVNSMVWAHTGRGAWKGRATATKTPSAPGPRA